MLNTRFRHLLRGVIGGSILLGLGASGAFADDLEDRRRELFQIMLEAPDNLDVAFEYAALSVQAGDLEGAIATLERMLIYAPGLPRIQLELGALYYRLGNIEVSRTYFEAVLANPGAPPEVVDRVNVYLAEIEDNAKPTRLSAALFAGLRWQSNANAAPDAKDITLNGLPFILGDDATSQSDFAFFTTGSAQYQIDLQSQGDRFEMDAVTYAAWQFEQTQLDTQLIEVTAGPAFNMARFGIDSTYLGLYAIGNGALLDEKAYFGTLGAGLRLAARPSPRTDIFVRTEYRHRWFNDTSDQPNSSLRTGDEYRLRGEMRYMASPYLQLSAGGVVSREEVEAGFYDNWEYGGYLGGTLAFPNPVAADAYPWAFNLGAGYLHRDYDEPDPAIDATATEDDDEAWASGALNIPVQEWLAIVPQAEYRIQNSNYETQDFDAWTLSFGLFAKF